MKIYSASTSGTKCDRDKPFFFLAERGGQPDQVEE